MLSNQEVPTKSDDTIPGETLEELYDRIEELKDQLDQENNPGKQ